MSLEPAGDRERCPPITPANRPHHIIQSPAAPARVPISRPSRQRQRSPVRAWRAVRPPVSRARHRRASAGRVPASHSWDVHDRADRSQPARRSRSPATAVRCACCPSRTTPGQQPRRTGTGLNADRNASAEAPPARASSGAAVRRAGVFSAARLAPPLRRAMPSTDIASPRVGASTLTSSTAREIQVRAQVGASGASSGQYRGCPSRTRPSPSSRATSI